MTDALTAAASRVAPGASAAAHDARWRMASRIVLAVALLLVVTTYRDYGMTWDEEISLTNGKYWLEWYESGFTQRAVLDDGNQRLYGSFFNGVNWLLARHSPLGVYETGHLLTAIYGWIALWAACGLGTRLMGPRAGFFAAFALMLTPGWYGHTFNNPKDVPFGVLYLLSLYAMVCAYRLLPRVSARHTAFIGIAMGLAIAVRGGAIVLLGCYAMLFPFWVYARVRSGGYAWPDFARDSVRFAATWLAAVVIAWLVMLPWWPYVLISPVANMIDALKESARFQFTAVVLYHGGFVPAQELPWHYLPRWFSKTLPDFYAVVLLGVGVGAVWARRRARRASGNHDLHAQLLFLAVAALGLPVVAVLSKAVMYDAYRHFLFVIPPLAVLVGCGVSWLAGHPSRALRVAALAPAGVLALVTVADMVALHPYQTVYFNRLNGGLPKAYGRYETDYWGASHREGVEWLADHYRLDAPPHSIRVANSAVELFTGYYLQNGDSRMARFISVPPDAPADVMLSMTRWNLHQKRPGRVVHTVERMGVPLLFVSELPQP